jgi:hypothetical protein
MTKLMKQTRAVSGNDLLTTRSFQRGLKDHTRVQYNGSLGLLASDLVIVTDNELDFSVREPRYAWLGH